MVEYGCSPTIERFMVIGPGGIKRCKNKPIVIAFETAPAQDGLKGSMSLCIDCLKTFKERFPVGFATFKEIKLKPTTPKALSK